MPKASSTKRQKLQTGHSNLNEIYLKDEFIKTCKEHYNKSADVTPEEAYPVRVIHDPFKVGVLPDVFTWDGEFVESLTDELNALEMVQKDNDLYKFMQSGDLHNETSPCITELRTTLETEVHTLLTELTGRQLAPTIDIFCSKYSYSDYLLCHDDLLENRCIAFNYYLNPDWSAEDGGLLDLYNTDENGDPGDITESLTPGHNMIALFEVSPTTFHQVSEILSRDKTRLTVTGWYRCAGKTQCKRVEAKPTPPLTLTPCISIDEDIFYKWVNPLYLAPSVQKDIRHKFETDSEIELTDFLQPELYLTLLEELENTKSWKLVGPPNKRRYEICHTPGSILSEVTKVIQSDAMFLTLSHLTGLQLHPLYTDSDDDASDSGDAKQESNPRCSTEVCRWSHSHYTLIRDADTHNSQPALDAFLFLRVKVAEHPPQ